MSAYDQDVHGLIPCHLEAFSRSKICWRQLKLKFNEMLDKVAGTVLTVMITISNNTHGQKRIIK